MSRRPSSLILALDIGSSSVRSALFDNDGTRIKPSTASSNYAVRYTPDGGAELEPSALLRAAKNCLGQSLRHHTETASLRGVPILAVAGSAFWHSLIALGRKREPISPVFTWADSRSTADAAALREKLSERTIQHRTGCMLRAQFWPAKLRWLQRTQPQLFRRTTTWASPAGWLFGELFGVAAVSPSMASGTGLYNLRTGQWDPQLCQLCRVRPEQLDLVASVSTAVRPVHPQLRQIPVFTAIGDGAASNLGSGADRPGRIAVNIGTSAAARSILPQRAAPKRIPFGLFKYVVDDACVVIGGATSNGGNLRQWLLRTLQLSAADQKNALSRTAAAIDGLAVLPFWVSERAPSWPENLRGTITGLTAATTATDILRAATTSTYYRLAQILDELNRSLGETSGIIVSGGVLHSPAALAILADCLGQDLRICGELESSLRGAAIHALEKIGCEAKPLLPGRLVRHQPALSARHRERRRQQEDLEKRLR